MKRTLVVLADEAFGLTRPLPGGDEFQTDLVEAALKDILKVCQEVQPGPGSPPPHLLLVYPDRRDWHAQIAANYWLLVPQMGLNLAQRLDNVLLLLAPAPDDETIFLGVRTPHLTARALQHAFIALGQRGTCLGPTPDGGAYALGIKGRWPTGVLQQVRWHEPEASEDLKRLFRRLQIGVALLDEMAPLVAPTHVGELTGARPAIDRPALPFLKQIARKRGLIH